MINEKNSTSIASKIEGLRRQSLALLNESKPNEALPVLETILKLVPDDVSALDHLATAQTMLGLFAEAEQSFQKCIAHGALFPETLSNAARNAKLLGRPELQLDYAKRLLHLDGRSRHEGLLHCSDALRYLQRAKDAVLASKQALLETPDNLQAKLEMVRALIEAHEPAQALLLCEKLLPSNQENTALRMSHIEALIDTGELEKGISLAEELVQQAPDVHDAMSALGFHYQFMPNVPATVRLANASRYAQSIATKITPFTSWTNSKDTHRTLRIGLLSGDLRQHPVIYFLMSVLEKLQESSLTFYAYDTLCNHDEHTEKLRPFIKVWSNVKGKSDQAVAKLIQDHQIDILFDLSGYTTGGRLALLAMKPAPIQVSWLGFLGSTGLPSIDFVLADSTSVPIGEEKEFSEKIWRLPHCTHCLTEPLEATPVQTPPALKNGYITFGCLNKPNKINDEVLALWAKVLAHLPSARLHLRGNHFGLPEYRARFQTRLQRQGIDLRRVRLDTAVPRKQYLDAYHEIDIALDPFPYNGGTTTAEALWMGVPVLTISGDRMMARIGHSFLKTSGMEDWVAHTPAQFVELAVAKASDVAALTALRFTQRQNLRRSALFDPTLFSEDFETALRAMWRQFVATSETKS